MKPALFKDIFPQNVTAFLTDTSADFILPSDVNDLSIKQKNFLSDVLKVDLKKVYTMRQVHGNRVLVVEDKDLPQKGPIPDADAMVTNVTGVVLSMRTADCLPVFLFDPKKKCVGVVHAGWKGTEQRIVEKTLEAMTKNYGSQAKDVLAAFGPAIRECCYEVGEEFQKAFPEEVKIRKGQLCFNMPLANRNQLLKAGVKDQNIFDCGACTVCGQGYFSFRRDKEKAGRHLSLMVLSKR